MADISPHKLSRRRFLVTSATVGGALVMGIHLPGHAEAATARAQASGEEMADREINAWIVVAPDETVTIRIAQSEMGEGVFTALAMIVAEELDCDWSKVRVEYASANRSLRQGGVYGRMATGGSHAVRGSRPYLQQAGASARARLVAAAAARWGVHPSTCVTAEGVVRHSPTGRTVTYGSVAAAAAGINLAQEPAIKKPEEFKLIGQPKLRLDAAEKGNGRAVFGIDVRVPDMLYAAIRHCPVSGGSFKSCDETKVTNLPGVVKVVRLPDAVAVVADSFWRAEQAIKVLPVDWTKGPNATANSEALWEDWRHSLDGDAREARRQGNPAKALDGAAKLAEALYELPYLAHATMEPMSAVAQVQPRRVDIWTGTQTPDALLTAAARASGVAPENVYVHTCFLGGGFGRRLLNDPGLEAVAIARAVGRPVKLVWTREEDMRHDFYRPMAAIRFRAGLDGEGKPVAWLNRTVVAPIHENFEGDVEGSAVEGLRNLPYAIPNVLVDWVRKKSPLPQGPWRSVGSSQNAFAVESFIDELAHVAGRDPYAFRRELLAGKADWLKVLDTAAEKGGWGEPLPKGRGRGMAIHECFGSIVAEVVEVAISREGELRVERVTCAVDCGHVVNPLTVEAQLQSGVVYGLSAALHGEITLKDGAVEQRGFGDYPMLKMTEMPVVEVHFALSGGSKWGGIGEPGTPPIAPALANAIFAATGQRIRSLPIKHHDLAWS